MYAQVRAFFAARSVLEVDCPALSSAAPIDTHIDVMSVSVKEGEKGYLHTSPEYGMKRLLAQGVGDIYQLSHVFRQGEWGTLHNPEFTMLEWYRTGFTFQELIAETLELIHLFLPDLPTTAYSYREALKTFAGIDYLTASRQELAALVQELVPHLPKDVESWDPDTLLTSLMSFVVEPQLGKEELCVIQHFPASQAALSKITSLGEEEIAERFEVYHKGIELANGYHELTDPIEQRQRFEKANFNRTLLGKEMLPIDERLLQALEIGIPDCCGVAVGFDRLLLLRHQCASLAEVLPFPWPLA
jgi:lysyl-tRNA synthetase class 2